MREIKYIVIHCTATQQTATVDSIKKYWREVMKWRNVGYHWLIEAGGKRHQLAKDSEVTNGVAGHNSYSLHISYIGGVDPNNNPFDNRTDVQKQALIDLVRFYKGLYPKAIVQGHKDFAGVNKACPSFDAKKEFAHF